MLSFWEEAAAFTVGFRECYTHYNKIYSKYLDINWMQRTPSILLCIFFKKMTRIGPLFDRVGGQDMVDCSIFVLAFLFYFNKFEIHFINLTVHPLKIVVGSSFPLSVFWLVQCAQAFAEL